MKTYEAVPRFSPVLYGARYESNVQKEKRMGLEVEQELATLREWGKVQKELFDYIFVRSVSTGSWRKRIEDGIDQCTCGRAQIWWEPLSKRCISGSGHIIEICHQQTRYGILKLTHGYLVSHLAPNIHQAFGQLCALIINFAEHQALVEALLKPLQPLYGGESLTSREKEVLELMASGESEGVIAEQLSIALTTVRTHRHNMYRSLDVHSSQEALLRSFALRLLNWLDISETSQSA